MKWSYLVARYRDSAPSDNISLSNRIDNKARCEALLRSFFVTLYQINMTMKIKDSLSLRKIADEYIMIADNGDALDYTTAIALNETAVFLIQESEGKEFTKESWAQLLVDNYEVEYNQALSDVESLIDSLYEIGIIA